MDGMIDDYDYYGDTDPNNIPGDDDGGDPGTAAPTPAPASAGDGLPGVAIPDHPGLRGGAFKVGQGVLGIYRSTDGQGAEGPGGSSGYQALSWRDSDPEAITYDLYQKQRQLNDAQTIAKVLGWGGGGQTVSSAGAKAAGQLGLGGLAESLGALSDPYVGVGGLALGAYMGGVEVPRLQNEVKDLQARQRQFGRSRT